ncbi:hypothetical protein, partial [Methylocystis sp.]|uniref:hypothetical protein n=1 Tax=Methylocystis sp. TaxID=1911079 RepID=UPI0025F5DE90
IMLVQTVCRRERQSAHMGWRRRNVFHFDVGGYRFWVNAAVGYLDGRGKRRHTGNLTRSVVIEPTPFIGNFSVGKFAG